MKEDKLYNLLIIGSIIGIIAILILIFTTNTSEAFTELYFEDHTNLPSEIKLGDNNQFSFSIHNLEQKTKTYTYQVSLINEDGTSQILDSSSISLNNNETVTVKESLNIKEAFGSAEVLVQLDSGEEIHFWIKEKQ